MPYIFIVIRKTYDIKHTCQELQLVAEVTELENNFVCLCV